MKKSDKWRPFGKLAGLKEKLRERKNPKMEVPHLDDEELFRKAMADVREIKEFRSIPYTSPRIRPSKPSDKEREALNILKRIVERRAPINLSLTEEYVEWVNPGYNILLKDLLHEGFFSVQDYIDLHGYTVEEAKEELFSFISRSRQKGFRCIKVIHGRGLRSEKGPVLKKAVLCWLQRDLRKWVIAYCTASAKDGGLGATYVLLKV